MYHKINTNPLETKLLANIVEMRSVPPELHNEGIKNNILCIFNL